MPDQLHPTVEEFKQFVQKNPAVVQEVRAGRKNWQQLYEDWYMLGEVEIEPQESNGEKTAVITSDKKETKEESKNDFMSQIFGYMKKMDMNQVQSQINNLSSALTSIQGVISQFQSNNRGGRGNRADRPNPFSFRKD